MRKTAFFLVFIVTSLNILAQNGADTIIIPGPQTDRNIKYFLRRMA